MSGKAKVEKLVRAIAVRMHRESRFSSPSPSVLMSDPYGVLDLIRDEFGVTPEEIDGWLVAAQEGEDGGIDR